MINLQALKSNVDLEIENSKAESKDTFRCAMGLAELVREGLSQAISTADVVEAKAMKELFEELEKFMSPYRYPIIADLRKKYLGEDTNVLTNTEGSTDA